MHIDERGRINRWDLVERPRTGRSSRVVRRRSAGGGFFSKLLGLIKFLIRLSLSPVAGAFIAGLIAAIMEANGVGRVEEGSPMFFGLILITTLFVWRFLGRVGPLKRRVIE